MIIHSPASAGLGWAVPLESAIDWHRAKHQSHRDKELSAMGHSEVTMETLISQEHRGIMIVVPYVAPPLPVQPIV